jgi:hypothetical protein
MVTCGAVLSILIVRDSELTSPAPFVAEHVTGVPAVSAVSVVGPQVGEEIPDSASFTLQLTVTALLYQPFIPTVPLIVGVITGAVVSVTATRVVVSATSL